MKQQLSIKGMSCQHCVARVEESVKALDGVKKIKVQLKKATGTVKYDESLVNPEKISQTINDLGYQAEFI
ncbi:copper chaperone CopZ [Enterococcus sp. 10A9_DIV0425]|uniref:Copper chaperone CopZ n=1 Tax=Candidatus Enterococcus wittei TaxID=1987383 RepID=A0A2C9XQJ9_9ENTE|nr:copper chaperone CopZ [Enterococcus sp. 10A9_DIV0425]OTP12482.1 copper chaperone CopZ [Enterococcus sp. 10A9_DIV0425]THE10444.1 copper chaperone CopZ [Enterococcus hirae]